MRETWRWFGPDDPVTLDDARQAGAKGIVTALHQLPPGVVWTADAIARRQQEVARLADGSASGLTWDVIESLPVSEAIKTQSGTWRDDLDAYRQSLRAVAACGLEVVCYNFMPVLDWTRTVLAWPAPGGGRAMRYDHVDVATFDLHILERPGAAEDFPDAVVAAAGERFAAMDDAARARLRDTMVAGLPGAAETLNLATLRDRLDLYARIDAARLRSNLVDFLAEVVPTAEEVGVRLCCHPDDPPWPLLGLPRVMSTEADYAYVLGAVDSPANGVTLCSGSLGCRPDIDLPGMARRLGPRIHFVHLRNVRRDTETVPTSFFEDGHLEGQTDMVALVGALLAEEARRRTEGRPDAQIPMRPDHGQELMDDVRRGSRPGYPAIGRLKGLAELRGIMRALEHAA